MSKFPFSVSNLLVCDLGNIDNAGKMNLIGMRTAETYLNSSQTSFDDQTIMLVIAPHARDFSFSVEYFGPENQGLLRGDFDVKIDGEILPHYRCQLKMPIPPMKFLGFGEYAVEVRCEAGVVARERFYFNDVEKSALKPNLHVDGKLGINPEFFLIENGETVEQPT